MGCEIVREGSELIFEYGNNQISITIGGLIFSVVFVLALLWWIYAIIKRYFAYKNSDLWVCTVARIIDENMYGQDRIVTHRAVRTGSVKYQEKKIEYFVNGKSYISYLNGSDVIGCNETVEIEYKKSRPTIIRKKKG